MLFFIFFGHLNAHHQEWLKSASPTPCAESPTDRHGIAAFNFVNLSSCTQLIKEPTHNLDNYLDLLLTDVPGVVDPLVDPPHGNSDHFSILFSVNMNFKIPNFIFSRKVYLMSRVNWHCVIEDL